MTTACRALLVAAVVALVTACSADPGTDLDPGPGPEASGTIDLGPLLGGTAPPVAPLDTARIQRGEIVYQERCASCHGAELQGVADWKSRNADGTWKPPPHDSTGHTWHHSDQLLTDIIGNGGGFPETRMPAFASVLSEDDITDILEYLKANWGEQEREFQWRITWQEANR